MGGDGWIWKYIFEYLFNSVWDRHLFMCRAQISLEVEVDDDVVEVLSAVKALQILHRHSDASFQWRRRELDEPEEEILLLLQIGRVLRAPARQGSTPSSVGLSELLDEGE